MKYLKCIPFHTQKYMSSKMYLKTVLLNLNSLKPWLIEIVMAFTPCADCLSSWDDALVWKNVYMPSSLIEWWTNMTVHAGANLAIFLRYMIKLFEYPAGTVTTKQSESVLSSWVWYVCIHRLLVYLIDSTRIADPDRLDQRLWIQLTLEARL